LVCSWHFYEGAGEPSKLLKTHVLATRPAPGQWVDLAIVSDGDEVACYVDGKAVLAQKGALDPQMSLGLWSGADANFRKVQLRR
jgi:hypothetical protein